MKSPLQRFTTYYLAAVATIPCQGKCLCSVKISFHVHKSFSSNDIVLFWLWAKQTFNTRKMPNCWFFFFPANRHLFNLPNMIMTYSLPTILCSIIFCLENHGKNNQTIKTYWNNSANVFTFITPTIPGGIFEILIEKSYIQKKFNLGQSQLSIFIVTENIILLPNFQFVLQKMSEKPYNRTFQILHCLREPHNTQ